MENFIKIIDTIVESTGRILSYCIIPMIFIVLYTATMRYVFKVSVSWGFESALFLFGISSIAGGAFTHLHKSHVTVDAFTMHLPEKYKVFFSIFSQLIIIAVGVCLLYFASKWAYKSTLILERSIHGTEWNPYIWWFKWVIPLSSFLLILQCFSEIAKQILILKKGKGE